MLKGGKIFTTSAISSFIGRIGEVAVDMTKKTLVVFDGSTPGGTPLALQNHTHPNATDTVAGFLSASDHVYLYNHRHPNATETSDGFMSQIDKAKLDNISVNSSQSGNLIQNGEFEVAGTTDVFAYWTSANVSAPFTISQTSLNGPNHNYCYMSNTSPITMTANSTDKASVISNTFSASIGDFITVTGFWNAYAGGTLPANITGTIQATVKITYSDSTTVNVGTINRSYDTNGWQIFNISCQVPAATNQSATVSNCSIVLTTFINNTGSTSQAVNTATANGGFDSIFVYKQTLPLASADTPNSIVYRDANGNFAGSSISATGLSVNGNGSFTGSVTAGNYYGNFLGTIPNALYSTGTYYDPAWIPSLNGSKIVAGTITPAQIKNVAWNQLNGTTPNVSIFANDAGYINSSSNITGTSGGVQSAGGRETASAFANTVILRDSNARAQVQVPSAYYDIANKGYVDAAAASASAGIKVYIGPTPPSDTTGLWVDTSS